MTKIFLPLLVLLPLASSVAQGQTTETKTNETSVPPTMTKEQIFSLLEEKKHIPNQWQIADTESYVFHFKNYTPPKEYPMIVQQLMAIDSAGKSKDKVFIPYLLDYFDYVSLNSSWISPIRLTDLTGRRARMAALDALMNINSSEGLSSYIEGDHPIGKRVSALSVLREIDYDKAVELGTKLLEDPEAKKDAKLTDRIKRLMLRELPPPKITSVK